MKEFKYLINGNLYTAILTKREKEVTEIDVNGKSYIVTAYTTAPSTAQDSVPAFTERSFIAPVQAPSVGSPRTIRSPLPGNILSIDCKVGDVVKKGQKILVLEAMKMENIIAAEKDGTISEIRVNKGDTVLEGAELVKIS
ncbi:MAG: biotin/lipoyl-binding protein [Dysgonamonadaceae bacterium]|jgi:biotin carboxyl carrier protein|nr:biotin/lipoyl-binding protein [Dysgonamonadaceae bacterium]